MVNKKKKLKKIGSLKKRKQEHIEKIENYEGRNYALINYWEKEIENFEAEIKEEKADLNGKES